MGAYDEAYSVLAEVTAVVHTAKAVADVLAELREVHERALTVWANLARAAESVSVVPFPAPSGEPHQEPLADGIPAAIAALAAGQPVEARRILSRQVERIGNDRPLRTLELRILLLRAAVAERDLSYARVAIEELSAQADERDDSSARCELAFLAAQVALLHGDAQTSLTLVDGALALAADAGLGLLWIDLLTLRSRVLLSLDEVSGARESAAAALLGPAGFIAERWPASADLLGASHTDCDYRSGAGTAAEALQSAGGEVPPDSVRALADGSQRKATRVRIRKKDEEKVTGLERRIQLHEAALAAIESSKTCGLPLAVYFRKYDITVTHGPMEYGPRLIENVLQDSLPDGTSVVTIQSHDDITGYSGTGHALDRDAPALLLDDEHWKEAASALIAHADLIVSECLVLTPGVRFELEIAYKTGRWDRTVLVLPPLQGALEVIDSDPLIQMFPRCVWADTLHTEPIVDAPVMADLIARIETITALPEEERRRLADRALRDERFPVDLRQIAESYEFSAAMDSQWQDEDERVRYYGFWRLFRAASIRGARMLQGDDSFENRSKLNGSYVQMSAILLDFTREGDRIVLIGDLTMAEQCAESAVHLIRESDGPLAGHFFRERAVQQWEDVRKLRQAVEAQPERFILRPRYGPFVMRKMSDEGA
jgi:hypothetical protein